MIRDTWTTTATKPTGEEIIVVKVASGNARNRWLAQRVINAVRTVVPLDRIALDVVALDGEPTAEPVLHGSSADAERLVRGLLPMLAGCRWKLTKLDW